MISWQAMTSISNSSGLPSCSLCWNLNCGPHSVLELRWNWTAQWRVVRNLDCKQKCSCLAGRCIQLRLIFTNSELWLSLSISVLIVLKYNIYINYTGLDAVPTPVPQVSIWSIFVESLRKEANLWCYFTATNGVLIRLQIAERGLKEYSKLHNLGIHHIVIQSDLKYLIGAKVPS